MKERPPMASLAGGIKSLCAGLKTQSQQHIQPLHAYCAARLVLEGGFPPEWVEPGQAFFSKRNTNLIYELEPALEAPKACERRVLGGIKYKDVDVTVLVPGLGPALGISAKSTGNAFRNLTNRMEEALGECTNIHLIYPGFVFGFLHLIRFSKESEVGNIQDASFDERNQPLPAVRRYYEVLLALAGRNTITDPGMRYEAVGLLVYRCAPSGPKIWTGYPAKESLVHFSNFFQRLYDLYDVRFGYPDPGGPNVRRRGAQGVQSSRPFSIRKCLSLGKPDWPVSRSGRVRLRPAAPERRPRLENMRYRTCSLSILTSWRSSKQCHP